MLSGNCEKMVLSTPPPPPLSITNNQWPQQQSGDDHHKVISSMASSSSNTSTARVLEKPGQELLQQQQQALKCPRCDSSNTKFCYYNNYSLSQPRHFCKACKRYWTRGGTLRNVPVGGGCRKNKRVKIRPTDSVSGTTTNSCSQSQPQIDVTASNHLISPLFFGLTNNNPPNSNCDVMNLPTFSSRFNSSRVVSSISNNISGYDLQSQLNSLGLGFSSGMIMSPSSDQNGLFTSNHNSTLLFSNYNSIFGGSSTSSTSCASVMPSLVMQQKYMNNGGVKDGGNNSFQGLVGAPPVLEEKLVLEGENRLDQWNGSVCQNQIFDHQHQHQHVGLSDPSSLYWSTTTTGGAAWNDQQPNIKGPSVTSLI